MLSRLCSRSFAKTEFSQLKHKFKFTQHKDQFSNAFYEWEDDDDVDLGDKVLDDEGIMTIYKRRKNWSATDIFFEEQKEQDKEIFDELKTFFDKL